METVITISVVILVSAAASFFHGAKFDKVIQCVPIKRKPVLLVGYLYCHARFNQTICFIIKGIFSSFI